MVKGFDGSGVVVDNDWIDRETILVELGGGHPWPMRYSVSNFCGLCHARVTLLTPTNRGSNF